MPPAPPSCVVDEIKLHSQKKFHHPNLRGQHKSHARTPTRALATIRPRLLTPSRQIQHTIVNEAGTNPGVYILRLTSTSPSPAIQIPSGNQYQSKIQPEAHHHQTGVPQTPCHMASGWQVHPRTSVREASGCQHKANKVACTTRPKKKNARDSGRVADITPMIRIPRARIQDEKGKEIGREIARRKRHHRRKSVGGRRI